MIVLGVTGLVIAGVMLTMQVVKEDCTFGQVVTVVLAPTIVLVWAYQIGCSYREPKRDWSDSINYEVHETESAQPEHPI